VLIFFPFPLVQAGPGAVHPNSVPMLPVPSGRGREEATAETAWADAIAQAGYLAAGFLRGPLMSVPLPFAALSHQANLFFGQIAAALAFEQMVRQAASIFGMCWPAAGRPYFPQPIWAAGLWPWPSPFLPPAWPSPAVSPAWPVNPWSNAWPALSQALTVWAKMWEPVMAQGRPASSSLGTEPPFTATLSLPGCTWSVALR
jgi:hypothetical protein